MIFYAPRLPLAVVVLTVLGFAIKQASRRAQWEARDRRVANELTAFPAFLSHLPEEKRGEVAEAIALKYFPGPEIAHDEPSALPMGDPDRVLGLDAKLFASLATRVVFAILILYVLAS